MPTKLLCSLLAAAMLMIPAHALDNRNEAIKKRADVEKVAEQDPEMNAAIATAQANHSVFLKMLASDRKGVSEISFKFPLGGWEHIWVTDVAHNGEFLTGKLNNKPMQSGYKMGHAVRVKLEDISDWAFRGANGTMQGNYTTRVLLKRIDPARAQAIRQHFNWK